ncbi:MAG TPA: hypothetical protein PK208_13795 [Fibrobacteria bacterium]|nr:hypothetical protein [Fibrobacteria bacterium]
MDANNFYDFDEPEDKAPIDLDDLDDKPTPWYRRPKLWILTAVGCIVLAVAGSFLVKYRVSSGILELAEGGHYDSAWAALDSARGSLSSCKRSSLTATIAHMDTRADTILFHMAESLKMCFVSEDSLLGLAALANLRILDNSSGLDSSKRWTLQSMAFGAVSRCIRIDSANRSCYQLGYQALSRMNDAHGQVAWLELATKHVPKDTLFPAQLAQARRADTVTTKSAPDSLPNPAK